MRARIVIIGGGVIGVSVALHAARRTDPLKEPVMVIERDHVGTSPSSCSAAVLGQFYGSKQASGMARDSLRYYQGIESKTGRNLGFLKTGVLTLAKGLDERTLQRMRDLIEMQSSIGIRVQCVDADEIRKLFPGIVVPDEQIAAWEPEAGCLDPHKAIESLASLARSRGAVIREGNSIEDIVVEGGRVVGVETSEGLVECEQVVITAGPWSKFILAKLGIELPLQSVLAERFYCASTEDESLEEVCHESTLSLAGPEASGATGWYSRDAITGAPEDGDIEGDPSTMTPNIKTAHPVLTDPETGFYVRCDPLHGRVSVGQRGGDFIPVEDPDSYDPSVGAAFSSWAREVLVSRLPCYADLPDVGVESGLFTRTPDNQPVLGRVPKVEGLYIACAFSGHSFTMAPSVGEGMAQVLLGEPVSAFDEDFYSAERFL